MLFRSAESESSYALIDVSNGNKAIVRLDAVHRVEPVLDTDGSNQKVVRSKSFNEYRAYEQFNHEQADIVRN